jgi:hypothetical protein
MDLAAIQRNKTDKEFKEIISLKDKEFQKDNKNKNSTSQF